MADGRLRCVYTKSLLLLGALLCGADASDGPISIHKLVGETVEFPSGINCSLPLLTWNYNSTAIATSVNSKDNKTVGCHFNGRLDMIKPNYILRVRNLTLLDNGVFHVTGENFDGSQIPTKTYILHVEESISKEPILTMGPLTWHASNKSCSVFLECNAQGHGSVFYNWTLEHQTHSGAKIHFSLQPQDTIVTCTAYNMLSNKSTSTTVKCSQEDTARWYVHYALAPAGGAVILALIIAIAYYCRRHCNDSSDAAFADNTIYADVRDSAAAKVRENRSNSVTNPNSIYETVDDRVRVNNPVQPKPQTIYDRIQFDRQKDVQLSPFHVC